MADIRRLGKQSNDGGTKGEGDSFLFPPDCVPEGITEGENVRIVLVGTMVSIDEQGGVLRLDRIETEKTAARKDPTQNEIEKGLQLQVELKA